MVFIPIGLKSKVKDPPFLVACIVVLTAFFSITNFKYLEDYHTNYHHSEERQKYFFQLRSVYVDACSAFQDEKTCDYLIKFKNADSLRSPFAANADAERYLLNAVTLNKNIYRDWHDEEFLFRQLEKKQRVNELNQLRVISLQAKKVIHDYHVQYNLLATANTTPYTLIKAQLTHSDWFHLIGNLVFFLFFGACLEQAMGRRWLLGIYVLGGTLGLFTQMVALSSHSLYVVGASANIFACAGAFLRLYWRQSLQILFSMFFVVNKTIKLPTWSFFVFFVLIQQLTGLTAGDEAGVAYLAHMVGLAFGFGAAHVWSQTKRFVTSSHLIFPYEKEMLASVEARGSCKDKFNVIVDLMFYAPSNIEAYKKFHAIHDACTCDPKCMSPGSQKFFAQQISIVLKDFLLEKDVSHAGEYYEMAVSLQCDIAAVIQHMTANDVMTLGNYLYKLKNEVALKELFAAAAKIFPDEQKQVFLQFLDSLEREKGAAHAS